MFAYLQGILRIKVFIFTTLLLSLPVSSLVSAEIFSRTVQDIENELATFSGQQAILKRVQFIKALANDTPTKTLTAWLVEQQKSTEHITRSNPDHLNQKIIVASVSQSAEAVLLHWRVGELAMQYIEQVSSNIWQWEEYIASHDGHKSMALSRLLASLNKDQIQLLQAQLVSNRSALATLKNNDILALVEQVPSMKLSEQLIRNNVDEFSYQHIQQLAKWYTPSTAVKLLKKAQLSEQLVSLSLTTMAKYYGNNEQVQSYLIKQLTQKSNRQVAWYAAAAIAQSTSKPLQQQVKLLTQKQRTPAVAFVRSAIDKSIQNKQNVGEEL